MKRHRGLFIRNGYWWVNFWLDGANHRWSTGIRAEGKTPPPVARAAVPVSREQKFAAVKARAESRSKAAQGTTELHAFTEEYLKRKPAPRGIEVQRAVLAHLTRFFRKGTDMEAITRAAAHRYHQHIAAQYADGKIAGATANQRLSYARALFSHAMRIERIPGPNPFSRFERFPAKGREYVLDRADEPVFLAACPPWLRAMVEDNLYLGLRSGEMRDLKRADFRPNEGAGGYIVLDVSQTKGGRIKAAQGRPQASSEARIALTPAARERMAGRPVTLAHPYFYSGPTGGPVNKSTMEKAVRAAWEEAAPRIAARRGISPADFQAEVAGKGGFSFYTTRHTAATRAGEAGFTTAELQQKFRWATPAMAGNYVHGSDEWAERAARKIAEMEG